MLAEHPDLVEGDQELDAFATHLKECLSCAQTLPAVQEFEQKLREAFGGNLDTRCESSEKK
jgi:hypothetical protein